MQEVCQPHIQQHMAPKYTPFIITWSWKRVHTTHRSSTRSSKWSTLNVKFREHPIITGRTIAWPESGPLPYISKLCTLPELSWCHGTHICKLLKSLHATTHYASSCLFLGICNVFLTQDWWLLPSEIYIHHRGLYDTLDFRVVYYSQQGLFDAHWQVCLPSPFFILQSFL